jgi:chemotaxis protein CheY-P-specific phosphatase CheC
MVMSYTYSCNDFAPNQSKQTPTAPEQPREFSADPAGEIGILDILQEIANVAMGQAADLLARLLKVLIKLPVPNVNLLEAGELQMALEQIECSDDFSAVCQGFIGGGISGEAFLMFSDSSLKEIAKLLNYKDALNRNEELELLMELASILIGACTTGIARQLDVSFSQGQPVVLGHYDRVSELIKSNAGRSKQILAIELSYDIENYDIQCDLLLLLTEDSLASLNTRLSYYLA